jgi:hypothetical protein
MANRAVELLAETYITDTTIRDSQGFGIWAKDLLASSLAGRASSGTSTRACTKERSPPHDDQQRRRRKWRIRRLDINADDGSARLRSPSPIERQPEFAAGHFGPRQRRRIVRASPSPAARSAKTAPPASVGGCHRHADGRDCDNTIVRNRQRRHPDGVGVSATMAAMRSRATVSLGSPRRRTPRSTRANNIVQDNATDVSGTLTFVGGDCEATAVVARRDPRATSVRRAASRTRRTRHRRRGCLSVAADDSAQANTGSSSASKT